MRRALGIAVLVVMACGMPQPPNDAGVDAGVEPDAGVPDAGVPDAGRPDAGPRDASVTIFPSLSDYGLFEGGPGDGGRLTPTAGNVEYELSTALFSDYATKQRTIRMPEGEAAHFNADDVLDFPVGTIITKTFSFPADRRFPNENVNVVETRLLVHQPHGWEAWPYVWNATKTDATRRAGGLVVPISFIDLDGGSQSFTYLVPSRNQCLQCHHVIDDQDGGFQVLKPIGVKARYLNRVHDYGAGPENQLAHFAALQTLDGLPADGGWPKLPDAFDPDAGSLDLRARTYLEINCGHCHRDRSTAGRTSRLYLDIDNADPFHLGVCKLPGSTGGDVGGRFDIVPGDHSQSILWFRQQTVESGKMMPQIGRALSHVEGASLLEAWIDAMPPRACE